MASDTQPISPTLFGQLVALAISAGQQRAPSIEQNEAPAHNPFIQAAVAVREQLHEQPELFDPVMNRFTALMDLYNNNRLGRWIRTSPRNRNAQDIHPAVVHVAAQYKLKKNGRFPEKRFLQAVEEMAAAYPSWDEIAGDEQKSS